MVRLRRAGFNLPFPMTQSSTFHQTGSRKESIIKMATQQDLQELLRLVTVVRKTPMMQAMTQIKALQAVDLRR